MRVRFVRGLGGLGAAIACAGLSPTEEGVPRILLDLNLRPQPIRLLAIDTRTLTYLDPRGQVRTETLDQYAALLPADAADGAAGDPLRPTTTVDLADGRRFSGHPTGKAGDDTVLEWRCPELGDNFVIPIPLELVRRVTLGPSARGAAAAGARDQLLLVNGDTLDGFVETIGDPARIEQDSTVVEVPLERIAEVRLGGPAVPPSGLMVWMRGGTVARVSSLSTDRSGKLTLLLAPMDSAEGGTESLSAQVPIERLTAAGFDMGSVTPLASLSPSRQDGSPDRVFSDPIRVGAANGAVLGAPDIELPGPMSVSWPLPEGAARLGGIAELPEDCRAWGDCSLVMTVGMADRPREVFRAGLNGANPRAEFNVALPASDGRGAVLTITVEAGAFGPIQDRVVLERAVLLSAPRDRTAPRPGG